MRIKTKVREAESSVTNFGSVFYHGKKTGKSNYSDFVYKHGEVFECIVNQEICAQLAN